MNPNVLARTIETVQGGGLVVILLNNISDIKQFYNLHMDCHTHYTTNAYHEVVPRFNKRFGGLMRYTNSYIILLIDNYNFHEFNTSIKSVVNEQ